MPIINNKYLRVGFKDEPELIDDNYSLFLESYYESES